MDAFECMVRFSVKESIYYSEIFFIYLSIDFFIAGINEKVRQKSDKSCKSICLQKPFYCLKMLIQMMLKKILNVINFDDINVDISFFLVQYTFKGKNVLVERNSSSESSH